MESNKTYGLIGHNLSYSFSKEYFIKKFSKENIENCQYEFFQLSEVSEFLSLIKKHNFSGLNVTIPYKELIIPYLNRLDQSAKRVGAVNVIKFESSGKMIGYNSDYYGFYTSLETFLGKERNLKGLVLGTGGSAKAVKAVLEDINITYLSVSRNKNIEAINYDQVNKKIIEDYRLIINCTPLGMYPLIDQYPSIPYEYCTENHYFYDLVYNPNETFFMQKGIEGNARVKNGLEMLVLQAEKSWQIWNS